MPQGGEANARNSPSFRLGNGIRRSSRQCYSSRVAIEGPVAEEIPLTQWLRDAGAGDSDAGNRVYAQVYAELRQLAVRQLGRSGAATLTPTALVNEAFLKLAGGSLAALNDRRHFFNLAARAMRQTVIDYARERLAEKRGGGLLRTELDEGIPDLLLDAQQTLAIDQALTSLEQQDPDLAETFALRTFAGLSTRQIAELRGVTDRTVQRNLNFARNYLQLALER
jgi:RNA polymerase sigma factor (TIGR02999 family)